MRFLRLGLLLLIAGQFSAARAQDALTQYFNEAGRFFKGYVQDGQLNYQAIRLEPAGLNRMLGLIEKADPAGATVGEQKVYWIYTYNLLVIRTVLEKYPVASVDSIPGFFTGKFFRIRNESLSLDNIEKEKLMGEFHDPRILLFLCKAGTNGPALDSESLNPEGLHAQTENRTRQLLNDTLFVKPLPGGYVRLHVLFRENLEEFIRADGSLLSFLNRYRQIPVGPDSRVVFYEPAGRLNDSRMTTENKNAIHGKNVEQTVAGSREKALNPDSGAIQLSHLLAGTSNRQGNQLMTFFRETNRFLNDYVYEGHVDYKRLKKNPRKLEKLILLMQQSDLVRMRSEVRKAYWVNVYNLLVIKSVVDHYPVGSVEEVPGFFSEKKIRLQGEVLSLNDMEQNKLKKEFRDPRINFLLCKGMEGGFPLQPEACDPELFSTQVINRTIAILQDTAFVRAEGAVVMLSDYFREYEAEFDFVYGGVLSFLNRYQPQLFRTANQVLYRETSRKLNEEVIQTEFLITDPATGTERPNLKVNELTSEADDGLLSSLAILPRNQMEVRLNNTLSTYRETYGRRMRRVERNFRYSTNITAFQFLYGAGRKTTIGLSLITRATLLDDINGSPFNVLRLRNDSNAIIYLRSVSPFIRFNIAEGFFQVRMQNTFNFPLSRIQPIRYNGIRFSEENPYFLQSQLFISHYFSDYVKIMLEAGVTFRFDDEFKTFTFSPRTPVSMVFGIPVTRKSRVFAVMEGVPVGNIPGYFNACYFREGAGFQIRAGKNDLSLYYSYNFIGRNTNAVNSMVLNVRIAW